MYQPSVVSLGQYFYLQAQKFQELIGVLYVNDPLENDQDEVEQNEGNRAMWISLFALASAAAVCLSVAAVMMEAMGRETQRG
jgi:hypothetical protein